MIAAYQTTPATPATQSSARVALTASWEPGQETEALREVLTAAEAIERQILDVMVERARGGMR